MKTIIKGIMIATLATAGLGLAACDSKKENAAEDQAAAVRESPDATADAIDSKADAVGGASEEALEHKADKIRESGDTKADAMEDKADKMDKAPE